MSGGLVLRMDALLSTEGDLADPANHAGLRGWIESMEAVIGRIRNSG